MSVVVLGFVSLALAACGARMNTVAVTPVERGSLNSFDTVAVQIEAESPDDVTNEMATLGAEIVQRVKVGGRFEQVRMAGSAESAEGTLLLKATILDAKRVGTGKRVMLGALAGRAGLTVDVKLVDAASGRELGAYTVKGESGGSAFSGGTEDAVKKAAEGIAEVVVTS